MRPPVASPAGRTGPSRETGTRPDPRSIPPHLRALLPLLAGGHARYRIAHLLGVRRSTLDPRLNRLYRLLGVHDREQAVAVARQIGLLPKTPKGT